MNTVDFRPLDFNAVNFYGVFAGDADLVVPVITLIGDLDMVINLGSTFVDPGFLAVDAVDGDITDEVVVSGSVDTEVAGHYVLSYDVSDEAGNSAQTVRRAVSVVMPQDLIAPVVSIVGAGEELVWPLGQKFIEPGYLAVDNDDGDITDHVVVTGVIDVFTPGVYLINYDVTDAAGNAANRVTRIVNVVLSEDRQRPTVSLLGSPRVNVYQDEVYQDLGFSALDQDGNNLTGLVEVIGEVDTSIAYPQVVLYRVVDSFGVESDPVYRIINVLRRPSQLLDLDITQGDSLRVNTAHPDIGDLSGWELDVFVKSSLGDSVAVIEHRFTELSDDRREVVGLLERDVTSDIPSGDWLMVRRLFNDELGLSYERSDVLRVGITGAFTG